MVLEDMLQKRETYIVELAKRSAMSLRDLAKAANSRPEFAEFFGKEHEISHRGVALILQRHNIKRNTGAL